MNDVKEGNRVIMDTGFTERLGSSDTAAAIMAGMQCGTAELKDIAGYPYMLVPDGMELVQCENLLAAPLRIKSKHSFEEPDSFCAYVEMFKDTRTRLYGTPDDLKIVAAIDDDQPGQPGWSDHTATLQQKMSPEWRDWLGASKGKLTQQELADFFEEHINQIALPDAGDLLNDIRQIHISTNTKCDSVQREGGDIAFSYSTETSAGTKTARGKIPSKLTLVIAPFRAWKQVQLMVALTYSLTSEKQLLFSIRLHQAEALVNAAYNDVKKHVEEKLGLPVLL